MAHRPVRPRTVENYALLAKGKVNGNSVIVKSKRKRKTPMKVTKTGKNILHSSNGQWSVTPSRIVEDSHVSENEIEADDTHVHDKFSVAEENEVVELHAQEQGDFTDSGDAAKVEALQVEIAEMKRSLTEKWLWALQREKERLQQQL